MAAAFQPTGRPELPRDSPAARNMMLLTNNFRAGAARVVASTADVNLTSLTHRRLPPPSLECDQDDDPVCSARLTPPRPNGGPFDETNANPLTTTDPRPTHKCRHVMIINLSFTRSLHDDTL